MAKGDKLDIRNAKRSAAKLAKGELRVGASAAKAFNKETRNANKAGKGANIRTTSSGFKPANSVSATKPSMPVKTGVKNKMKAQGAKSMSAPTSGYGKTTKKK
jgi:hypothetical protein